MSVTRKPPAKHYDPYGKRPQHENSSNLETSGIIEGRNAVIEALRSGITIDKVYLAKGESEKALSHIASRARERGAVVVIADRRKLDEMSVTHSHQGVIAVTAATEYVSVSDILEIARTRNEPPLIVICDEITDPHNLGAIIRTAEASGAHGVIIPKRRNAGLSAIVAKTSAGAVMHVAVARVANLSNAISELKDSGVWVFAATSGGDLSLWQADFKLPTALVIGSEGNGIGRLIAERCDFNVKIPMNGILSSLNASVSAALLMYEAIRQRSASQIVL